MKLLEIGDEVIVVKTELSESWDGDIKLLEIGTKATIKRFLAEEFKKVEIKTEHGQTWAVGLEIIEKV